MAEDFFVAVIVGVAVFSFMAGCLLVFGRVSPGWARSIWQGEQVLFVAGGFVWMLVFGAASTMSDVHGQGIFIPEFFAAVGISLVLPYVLCWSIALRLMKTAPAPQSDESSSVPLVKPTPPRTKSRSEWRGF